MGTGVMAQMVEGVSELDRLQAAGRSEAENGTSSIKSASATASGSGIGEGFAFPQETLGEILHGTGDHQPGVRQIEALTDGSREIEGLCNHHFASRAWKVEGNMVAKHTP